MAQVLDNYGVMQSKKLVVQNTIDFQTNDNFKCSLVSANQSADRQLNIPALSANQTILHNGSNLNPEKITINTLSAEASPADADAIMIRDDSTGSNKKVALLALKNYIGSLPNSTNNQVLVSDSGTYASVNVSGDLTNSAGAFTIANSAINNAKVAANANIATAKLAINAQVPGSAGTVEASKFVQVDANKDFTSVRNITGTGAFQAAEINIGASGWRFRINGTNLELQYYDGGSSAFVTKQVFTAA